MSKEVMEAEAMLAEASKKKSGFFSSLLGGGNDSGKVADLLEKAGNKFRIAEEYERAAETFCRLADLQLKNGVNHEAVTAYQNAAKCYLSLENVGQALKCYESNIDIQTDSGRFSQAAKTHSDAAELCETKLCDLQAALKHYKKAAKYFSDENQKSQSNKMELKVAELHAGCKEYEAAASIYSRCGIYAASNNLLKYGAKDHLFKAVLCFLCLDPEKGAMQQKQFKEEFISYADSREAKLVDELLVATEKSELETFENIVRNYDNISRLDSLCTQLLLALKKTIGDGGDIC